MIKVLHISDKLSVGDATLHGVTRLFSWWIPRFDKNRFEVSVCSLRIYDDAAKYLESLGIKVHCLGRGKFDPITLIDLIQIIKKHGISILHLHGYGAWTFGRLAGLVCNVSIVLHEHMVDGHVPVYQRGVDWLLSTGRTHSIAVSEAVKEFMAESRYISRDQISVIYNGIPMDPFHGDNNAVKRQIQKWYQKLGISLSKKIVGSVGRLSLIKGHKYFLEAAEIILKTNPEVIFVIVGDGELRQSLEELSAQLGIEDNVFFVGYCNDIVSILSLIDILVISSLAEGGPLTLFEGYAAGCAIVSTNTIGLRDTIEEGKVGFTVPPENAIAIAEKTTLLLNNDELLQEMKVNAKDLSMSFDISKTVKKIEDCYEKSVMK